MAILEFGSRNAEVGKWTEELEESAWAESIA